jgi:hypothetical protein
MNEVVTGPPKGYLEVGAADGEVVINHPDLQPDENGVGHITFSPAQARALARLLEKNAHMLDGAANESGWLLDDGRLCVGVCGRRLKMVTYTDPSAMRFAREVDAEAFRKFALVEEWPETAAVCVPREHSWGMGGQAEEGVEQETVL